MRRAIASRDAGEAGQTANVRQPANSGWPQSAASLARLALAAWHALPKWYKRPDFAAVLLAGAVLRLLWLDSTLFLGDQAQLLALARMSVDALTLPLTGIRSSIGVMNPPATIYLLLPFARLDPFWAALFTALANVVAVVMLYRLADHYAGRRAAFAAGLLYATASAPVWYSRFLWQQNLLAPLLLLFFWTLCRGVVERKAGWLSWNILLWGVAVQLHLIAAPLLLLTVAGALLSRRALGRRDLLAATLVLALLFLPSALWELATGASDLTALRASAAGKAVIDGRALAAWLGLLLPASRGSVGASLRYASTVPVVGALMAVMALLGVISTAWLVTVVLRPLLPPLLTPLVARVRQRAVRPNGMSLHDDNRLALTLADPRWRFLALLALWELAPLLVMLRHSQIVYPHYLLVSLPAIFLTVGIFLAQGAPTLAQLASRLARSGLRQPRGVIGRTPTSRGVDLAIPGPALLVGLVLLLTLGQTYGTATELLAIQRGAVDDSLEGYRYGLPLDAQRAALLAAQHAARPLGASVFVATNGLHQEPLGYLATTGYGPATVYESKSCLVAPVAGGRPAVTLAIAPGAGGELLPRLQGAALLQTLPTLDHTTTSLYRVPSGALLPGEVALPAAAAISGPAVVGYVLERTGGEERLVMHWAGAPRLGVDPRFAPRYFYGASPATGSPPVGHYWFAAQPLDAAAHPLAAPMYSDCALLNWGSDESVYAWLSVPSSLAGRVESWRVWLDGAPYLVSSPTIGPLRFTAGDLLEGPRVRLSGDRVIATP